MWRADACCSEMSHSFVTAVPVSASGVGRNREIEGAADAPGAMLRDLIHDVRQPLSVVESIAYYMELTSSDQQSVMRLQKIQAMVAKINQILEDKVKQLGQGPVRQPECYSFDS